MTPTTSYSDFEAARRAHTMLTGESSTMAAEQENLREIMLTITYAGSGGIITLDYEPFAFHIGSSSCAVALRAIERTSKPGVPEDPLGFLDILELSVVEQMQELQAALSLNKSQLARILRVSRPALYDWLRGREPNTANTERAHTFLRCLARTRASSASPLNARFVRQRTDLDGTVLLDLLCEERIDEQRVVTAIEQTWALGDAAIRRRATREERLRNLGFEDPGREQRREQLATNMALRDWPSG